jgi:hypothetical protein
VLFRDPSGLSPCRRYSEFVPVGYNTAAPGWATILAEQTSWDCAGADRRAEALAWVESSRPRRNGLDRLQTGLDYAGLIPGVGEFADGTNALIYLARGQWGNAGLSAAAMVPFLGWGATGAKVATRNIDDLVEAARKRYPKKADKYERHHVTPKYLGGSEKGLTVPIDAAYHQQITNAFRAEWGYGRGKPSPEQLRDIMQRVYVKFPLPGQ